MRVLQVFFILSSLALVDCAITIARRLAVGILRVTFHKSAVLLANELIKLVFCCLQVLRYKSKTERLPQYFSRVVYSSVEIVPVCVLYLVANLVSYPALSRIPASVFACISQLKILTTAVFSVFVLGTKISVRRWRSLLLLVLSVSTVTWESSSNSLSDQHDMILDVNYLIGSSLCFFQTVLTGLACVILEAKLKKASPSHADSNDGKQLAIWERNIQLSLWSITIYLPLALSETKGNLLAGWSPIVAMIAVLHAVGGVLVALSIAYTSSMEKTIAVCVGLVLTCLLGGVIGDLPPSMVSVSAAFIVGITVLVYKDAVDLEALQK